MKYNWIDFKDTGLYRKLKREKEAHNTYKLRKWLSEFCSKYETGLCIGVGILFSLVVWYLLFYLPYDKVITFTTTGMTVYVVVEFILLSLLSIGVFLIAYTLIEDLEDLLKASLKPTFQMNSKVSKLVEDVEKYTNKRIPTEPEELYEGYVAELQKEEPDLKKLKNFSELLAEEARKHPQEDVSAKILAERELEECREKYKRNIVDNKLEDLVSFREESKDGETYNLVIEDWYLNKADHEKIVTEVEAYATDKMQKKQNIGSRILTKFGVLILYLIHLAINIIPAVLLLTYCSKWVCLIGIPVIQLTVGLTEVGIFIFSIVIQELFGFAMIDMDEDMDSEEEFESEHMEEENQQKKIKPNTKSYELHGYWSRICKDNSIDQDVFKIQEEYEWLPYQLRGYGIVKGLNEELLLDFLKETQQYLVDNQSDKEKCLEYLKESQKRLDNVKSVFGWWAGNESYRTHIEIKDANELFSRALALDI